MRVDRSAIVSFLTWSLFCEKAAFGFSPAIWAKVSKQQQLQQQWHKTRSNQIQLNEAAEGSSQEIPAVPATPAPVLNGKRVLPYKVLMAGLKGHEVAAVYAIMNKDYKRG